MQTKFKYPAETTANAAKIPRQMSLFIKQDQITSNLRMIQATTTQGKHHSTIPRKRNPRKHSEESTQNHYNPQLNLNKQA
jgi:hypothetical protein